MDVSETVSRTLPDQFVLNKLNVISQEELNMFEILLLGAY